MAGCLARARAASTPHAGTLQTPVSVTSIDQVQPQACDSTSCRDNGPGSGGLRPCQSRPKVGHLAAHPPPKTNKTKLSSAGPFLLSCSKLITFCWGKLTVMDPGALPGAPPGAPRPPGPHQGNQETPDPAGEAGGPRAPPPTLLMRGRSPADPRQEREEGPRSEPGPRPRRPADPAASAPGLAPAGAGAAADRAEAGRERRPPPGPACRAPAALPPPRRAAGWR